MPNYFRISLILSLQILFVIMMGLPASTPPVETSVFWPTYKSPYAGEDVISIQYLLRHRGYTLEPDGTYGPSTVTAVKQLQAKSSLPENGIVGAETWPLLITPVRSGDSNEVVVAIQSQLLAHGYRLALNGTFDAPTEEAIKQFQKQHQLSESGEADVATWNKLITDFVGKLPHLQFQSEVEDYAKYDAQKICSSNDKPGVVGFREMVLRAFSGSNASLSRHCGQELKTEHQDGRAWDWYMNADDPSDVVRVQQLFDWLFASDGDNESHAMARRLGIMYIIWDRKIWIASLASKGWQPYTGGHEHRDHVHFSFSWDGAMKNTSFWYACKPE